MNNTINTKFGTAKINKNGYYHITSYKEGNNGKYLHKVIWEDHYNKSTPQGYFIHHINGNKLNNNINNLQCVKREIHAKYHNSGENNYLYGKKHSKEHKKKVSKKLTKNYLRVVKAGKNGSGNQEYVIKLKGKTIKWSVDKELLQNIANGLLMNCGDVL